MSSAGGKTGGVITGGGASSSVSIAGSSIGNLALVFARVGWDVSALTLSRFYALHIMALPIITLTFMLAHFIMVRRQGIAQPL